MTKNVNSRHFYSILAFFLFQVMLSLALLGCSSYPLDMVKKTTGLTLDNKINICLASGVENFEECKPLGSNWEKTESKMPAYTLTNIDGDALLEEIANNYLCQNIRDYSQSNNHSWNIYRNRSNFIGKGMSTVKVSQFYEDYALNFAVSEIKTKFKGLGVVWSPEIEASLEQHLKNQFRMNSKSQGTLIYIVLYLQNTSLPYDASSIREWAELNNCFEKYKSGQYDLITGIAGFAILDFNTSSKIYDETSVKNAINAVFQNQSPELISDSFKNLVSLSIVSSLNKKITTEYLSSQNKNFFQPLWIQKASFKQVSVIPTTRTVWWQDEILSVSPDLNDSNSYSQERLLNGFSENSEMINLTLSGVVSPDNNPNGNTDAWIIFAVYINGATNDLWLYDPDPHAKGPNHNVNLPISIKRPNDGNIRIKIRAIRADNPGHYRLKIWSGFKISGE